VPEVTGLLVPPDDPEALADAIERLMADRDLRLRLGEGARHYVTDNLSSAQIGRAIVALYRKLLDADVKAGDRRDTSR
jgi:glycosyltransferase involved in cell wall biosynthesis